MYKLENNDAQIMHLFGDKAIVCFGIGKNFELRKHFFAEKNLCDRILAVVDSDINKHGSQVEIAGNFFQVKNFNELEQLKKQYDFIIVVMAAPFNEIVKQIRTRHDLDDVEILNARYILQHRKSFLVSYSNIFQQTKTDVGNNGENMTISILAHNRSELTVRLLDSIQKFLPEYDGEILIGDNGSDKEELYVIEERLGRMNFKWRLVKFDRHYPIPIGKNKLNSECKSDWIFQLDNDMYLTGNPISKMNQDISQLGCSIWGLPYYNAQVGRVLNYGSNLEFVFDAQGNKRLTGLNDLEFCEEHDMWEPILCTYTSGGASLMRKVFFAEMGGYDENLFINEDVEFIYRANLRGYKIGNVGIKCLVHDHKRLGSELGNRYEAIRFDEERIRASKRYLREKYGFEFI